MFKVVAVMGILGACRREELCQMSLNNIEDLGKYTSEIFKRHCAISCALFSARLKLYNFGTLKFIGFLADTGT
ncbi:hypothetical protein NQ317_008965 [Molorchus minor]|uniref:Uncharacterized protein n=1 Tax=Molorchus minor TaxID=1323400 RepID=A0ABQ9IRK3_9CUCU|nr:hypothetical protein NQ317_008965 [Molorchus minor]